MSMESRKVDLRVTLLRLLKSREMYGYEILKKLRHERGTAHSGFLYGKLLELEKDGLVKGHSLGKLKGPERKSYWITEQGQQWLKAKLIEAISTIVDFYSDYMAQIPLNRILLSDPFLKRARETLSIVLVADFSSSIVETIMEGVMKHLEKSRLYFIKPLDVDVRWDISSSTTLDGTFSQIPLRDEFADLLIALRPPKAELPEAIREFSRVVTKKGQVRIFYPSTLIKQTFNEPLSFCDFIVWADQDYWREELIDEEELMRLLKKRFASYRKHRWMQFFVYEAMAAALP